MIPCGRRWETSLTYPSGMITHPWNVGVGVTLRPMCLLGYKQLSQRAWRNECDWSPAYSRWAPAGEEQPQSQPHTQNIQINIHTHMQSGVLVEPRPIHHRAAPQTSTCQRRTMKYEAKWAENSWGLMLSVIRIAPKWLIGSLCGYVITTTGATEAHHSDLSEGPEWRGTGCSWRSYHTVIVTAAAAATAGVVCVFVSYPPEWFVQMCVWKELPRLLS